MTLYVIFKNAMNKLDRIMGILLLLRGGHPVSASELARRFEVSPRTVYRDIESLSAMGIPVSADMGRKGGFKLGEGYFLPPVALAPEEAISLLLGLTFMRRLRVMPFPEEAELAEKKLLAVLPDETRRLMERTSRLIGFEQVPPDLLHPERDDPLTTGKHAEDEAKVVGRFLKAILSRGRVRLRYQSPYRRDAETREVEPRGIIWDRDRWYLVADIEERKGEPRMWRSDRVLEIGPGPSMHPTELGFGVEGLLGRKWLGMAMERWRSTMPVRIALPAERAELLKKDWYFGHALFETNDKGRVIMTISESEEQVSALIRWLGPGTELLEPVEWRERIRAECEEIARGHGPEAKIEM